MYDNDKSWTSKIGICPYCGCSINISSLSTESLRDSIHGVFILLSDHTSRCKKVKSKRLANVNIRSESSSGKGNKLVTFNTHKIYI